MDGRSRYAMLPRLPGVSGVRSLGHPVPTLEGRMRFGRFVFGSIEVDGMTYEHDLVIDRGDIRKRKKGPSKALRSQYGHTPLSIDEDIPWDCRRLVVGSGATGALPVVDGIAHEAARRGVQLIVLPTSEAIEELERGQTDTNAILHVTC
jgi:hypothetical protein